MKMLCLQSVTAPLIAHKRKHINKLNCQQEELVIALFCLLICQLPATWSLLVEVPTNTVVLQRGSAESIRLSCQSDQPDPLRWYVVSNLTSDQELLFNGYYLHPDAKSYCTVITDEPGANHLLLKTKEDIAQTYICFEPETLAEASADIIWIGSNLKCNDRSTKDFVNLTCEIEFRGNWAPMMEWKEQSYDGEEILTAVANTVTIPGQCVTSTLVMPVLKDNKNFTCTAKFDISGKPLKTTASNVPNYNHIWSHTVSTESKDEIPATSVVIISTTVILAVAAVTVFLLAAASTLVIAGIKYRKLQTSKKELQTKNQESGLLIEDTAQPVSTHSANLNFRDDGLHLGHKPDEREAQTKSPGLDD